jgi:small conductance mechanosensitive channel
MFEDYLTFALWLAVIGAAALLAERLITRWLKGVIRRNEIPRHIGNGMILTGRLIVLIGVVFALMHLGGLPSEAVVSVSAVIGAAVGFASTRTVGNLVAGIFLLVTRPFRVGDYIRVDTVEGVVSEVTLNYVRITTACGNTVSISTQNMLDKSVVNYKLADSDILCYPLRLSFDNSIPLAELEKLLEKVLAESTAKLPRKAEHIQTGIDASGRTFEIRIYTEKSEEIFTLAPKLTREIAKAIDELKKEKGVAL